MNSMFTLLCFLTFFSILVSSQLNQEFIYTKFDNISISGVSQIIENGVLRLTNDTRRLMGHAFYPLPIHFKSSSNTSVFSFSTCFAFAIIPEYPKLGGHGLAFTIAPSKNLDSSLPSQYLGLLNSTVVGNLSNHLFAVEFDTVQDFEFGDINDNHVGIDIDSLKSNFSAPFAYYDHKLVKRDLNLKNGKPILAWIDYDSVTKVINVTISPFSEKPKLPIISYELDLSPILKENMYVGFSASTGLLASTHYILGWSFKMNGVAKSIDLASLPLLPGTKKKRNTRLIIRLSIFAALFASVLLVVAFYIFRKIKNREIIEPWELEVGPHRYSYRELKHATRGFKDSELLGRGGFGSVYKGNLVNSNTEVAVKRIAHDSRQGLQEFVSEISSIGRLRHRNLVQLMGWCRRGGDLLLVYDYMPNGSLDSFLFDETQPILTWEQRFKIIKGVASGLLYLHEGYEQVVVHRDVKASNVLLDGELNGRLGDFGLARLCEHGSDPGTTRVVGTLGYLAPELPRTGRATTKSDVFAFGALLLEVVSGRRPIEHKANPEELVLVDWVWRKWKEGRVLEVVDRRLGDEINENEVVMVIKLGLMCSSNAAMARPSIKQVISYLEGEVAMPEGLRSPNPYEGGQSFEELSEDFVHTYPSSSFEKASTYSFTANEAGDGRFAPISASPRGETM